MTNNTQNPPVFIVGAMRSGTTLLRLMMDHHPDICVFDEFEYAVRWIENGRFPAIDDYYLHLELDRVFRYHQFEIDKSLDYQQLVMSFLNQAVAPKSKLIAGACVHNHFNYLPKIWQDARYVHLVRDPRDVARSSIGMNWVGNVWYGADFWLEPIRRWKKLCAIVPEERRMQIRFEDLIADYKGELTRVCEFLGLEYSPEMMTYPENSTYSIPDVSLTEQWKRKMTTDEIQWVESRCQGLMEEYGYQKNSPTVRAPRFSKKLALNIQHRTARFNTSIKRFGIPLWCLWQFAKRLPYCQLKRNILIRVHSVVQQGLK